jgi:DNA-binding Lrp family transcriptional regulator
MDEKTYEGFYGDAELLDSVDDMARQKGSQTALAKELGITPAYLSDVLNGRRGISDRFAALVGYRRVTGWEREVTGKAKAGG